MPPNPPSKAHGFTMRSMSLRDMQISKSEKKKFLAPPLPNPGDAPDDTRTHTHTHTRINVFPQMMQNIVKLIRHVK